MHPYIENRRVELEALCRQFRVERLELFGSAASDRFDPRSSDLDFIAAFADRSVGGYADRYLGFAEALEALFDRRIDLLTERSIRNPIFREAVSRTRQPIYEHRGEKAAA